MHKQRTAYTAYIIIHWRFTCVYAHCPFQRHGALPPPFRQNGIADRKGLASKTSHTHSEGASVDNNTVIMMQVQRVGVMAAAEEDIGARGQGQRKRKRNRSR